MDSFQSNHLQLSLAQFGYTNPFFTVNVITIVNTWVVLFLIWLTGYYIRSTLFRYKSPPIIIHTLVTCGEFFVHACTQALGYLSFTHCMFITALFMFIMLCNTIAVIPWLEEPTVDFNTTLCLSIISFTYIQAATIYEHGIAAYINGFLQPFFLMLPITIIGRLTSIFSMAVRLCGNIFSGAIISSLCLMLMKKSLLFELVGILPNMILILFFVLFEGILQAYIFTILSLTFLAMAVKAEGH